MRIEHWGTFEVANFGDLVFALVLEHHLRRSLPTSEVALVGPLGGTAPMGLGHPVRRSTRHDEPHFWSQVANVDAIILGGGDLFHAHAGIVAREEHPERLDPWAFAVEAGLLAEVRPFAWNAIGVPFELPEDLHPLVRSACAHVDLLSVRDEGSRLRLEAAGVDRPISVVPDTAVLLDDVVPGTERAAAVERLRAAGQLPPAGTPFVAVHVSFAPPGMLSELAGALEEVRAEHRGLAIVLLAIGPTHSDVAGLHDLARRMTSRSWLVGDPTAVEVAAVLEAADAVASSSFHAMLVSTVMGTPSVGFLQSSFRPAKLTDLARRLERSTWLVDRPSVLGTALPALLRGEGKPDRAVVERLQQAARHHLENLVRTLVAAERPPSDLAERDAAHVHAVARLRAAQVREQRLREDLTVLDRGRRAALASARTWEAAYWRRSESAGPADGSPAPVLHIGAIAGARLEDDPYRWGLVGPLFTPEDSVRLAETFPLDEAELREGSDGRRSWRYLVRCLLPMGRSEAVRPHALDPIWRRLADDLSGSAYRDAVSAVTGVDVSSLHLEANLFSYGPGGYQEPHPDLPEKVVTHVLWFNEDWEATFGGCLRILRSKDPGDIDRELLPELGWSALFVRSATSWHSVTAMTDAAPAERRALVATFHRPGSVSSMWGEAPD